MTRTGERAVTTRLRMPSWIARIEAPDGQVLGAGVLLAPDRVLTAAHVVVPGRRYAVRLVAVPALDAVPATVREDEHVPQREDGLGDRSGDLALLRLARCLPDGHATRLHRLAVPYGAVSMYGFPDGDDGGRWHGATLEAARGRDSQVQLRPRTPGELAAPGFSGGPVVDHASGRVIGIVLSVDEGTPSAFSHMSPTETILSHLPQVAAWTDGTEAVDPRLRTGAQDPPGALDVPFATELAAWFRGEGWPVRVTVVPEGGDRDWTLGRAVTLADRELRTDRNTGVFSHDPPETVPPAGAHDLALDASGLTAAEVMDRVAARLGIRDDPRPERLGGLHVPLAAVLVGVDQAAEPAALLGLLDRLTRQGARLLLVFRRAGERAEHASELLVNRPLRERWVRLHGELDRIVEELGPALDRLRDRVLPGPGDRRLVEQAEGGLRRTRMLRAWVAHTPDHECEPARAGLLFAFEDAAERRRRRLEQAIGHLDTRLHRREELLGRVSAEWPLCRRRAAAAAERVRPGRAASGDPVMEAYLLYEHALSVLRHTPCDVERAETAVERFIACCSAPTPASPAGAGDTPPPPPDGSRPAGPVPAGPPAAPGDPAAAQGDSGTGIPLRASGDCVPGKPAVAQADAATAQGDSGPGAAVPAHRVPRTGEGRPS